MRTEVRETKHGTDRYVFLEAQELFGQVLKHSAYLSDRGGAWSGQTMDQFTQRIRTGDESMVSESEEFLNQIENQVPVSRGWRNVDDVVGAIPNVPAFLAGHPQHMRRRVKVARDSAPLTIYMDLTSSGGISAKDVQRRGIVLLALVRMLVEHRPVELWVGASLGGGNHSGTVAWKIDTAPLDLARAAYHIGSTAMSRIFGYGLNRSINSTGGHWPFANYDLHCETAAQRLQDVLGWGEVLYIPGIYLSDPLTTDPVGWLKRTMQQYVGTQEEDE